MFELMIHMIGYNNLEQCFRDMLEPYYKERFSEELLFELATWCDDYWGGNLVGMLNELTEE